MTRTRTIVTWLGVDSGANLYILGLSRDGRTWEIVTDTPPLYMPAELHVGSAWQVDAHLSGGTKYSISNTCIDAERVKTPVGEFNTFKILSSGIVGGSGISMYLWVSPDVPYIIEIACDANTDAQAYGLSARMRVVKRLQKLTLASRAN